MQLYVVRHGEAAAKAPGGDAERPLTESGARRVRAVARGLRVLGVQLDLLLASPLRRAQETARLLAEGLGGPAPATEPILDGNAGGASILQQLADPVHVRARVAIVGHQPVLGELVALATSGIGGSAATLAPASVACIEFPGAPRIGGGQLVWLMPPDVLERLANG